MCCSVLQCVVISLRACTSIKIALLSIKRAIYSVKRASSSIRRAFHSTQIRTHNSRHRNKLQATTLNVVFDAQCVEMSHICTHTTRTCTHMQTTGNELVHVALIQCYATHINTHLKCIIVPPLCTPPRYEGKQ